MTAVTHASSATPSPEPTRWKIRRHARDAARLRLDLFDLLAAHPSVRLIGRDYAAEKRIRYSGLGRAGLAAASCLYRGRTVTVIASNRRCWRSMPDRRKLFGIRYGIRGTGRAAILVTHQAIRMEIRRLNLRCLAAHRGCPMSASAREAIVQHVATTAHATLWTCSRLVQATADGMSCVLTLMADGVLAFRLDRPLKPETRLWLAQRGPATGCGITSSGVPKGAAN